MNKLIILVCENFYPEFNKVVEEQKFEDVIILKYPSMCENKGKKDKTSEVLSLILKDGDEAIIFCSNHCDVLKLIPKKLKAKVYESDFCFSNLACDNFINYVVKNGGYIISLGWLKNWRDRIADGGFNRDTAKLFYKDFCRELVFFDSKIEISAEKDIKELSEFLELPYVILPVDLGKIKLVVLNAVYEWRLRKDATKNKSKIDELQTQCAEYAAILDLMGKMASNTTKRDVVAKIKEIFIVIFGAQKFNYWSGDTEKERLPDEIKEFILEDKKIFLYLKDQNRFCLKIVHREKIYGIIDAGEFLFREYIEKYMNFALEIIKICELVFTNIEQYDRIIESEENMRYSSTHDGLTGLYNRTYLNEILSQQMTNSKTAVFMFDIDRLKFVNDNFGHAEGDKLILHVSNILKKFFRETDTVARIGGDEFVAILTDLSSDYAKIINNRINSEIEKQNSRLVDENFKISVSIGYALYETEQDTIEKLMQKADELMYIEKNKRHKESEIRT